MNAYMEFMRGPASDRVAPATDPTPKNRTATRSINGGVQHEYEFPNGYGASVVSHSYSYGRESGLWELAVLDHGHLTYTTPITADVLGHLTTEEVDATLDRIAALERAS